MLNCNFFLLKINKIEKIKKILNYFVVDKEKSRTFATAKPKKFCDIVQPP